MEITFRGAAREVTGSCHLLHVGDETIALDCGLFQGRRAESDAKNRMLPISPADLTALVLSHAHIDHAGRIPFLVKNGMRTPIYATPATRDLCALMLADSAHIQEKDAEHLAKKKERAVEPLYASADVTRTMELMRSVPYDKKFTVTPNVSASYTDAGHILGSASVALTCREGSTERRVIFSGDVGRSGLAIIRDPHPPEDADVVIIESTYGNRDHTPIAGARDELARVVRETAQRGGRILIPAFAVGRTQELVYDLHELYKAGAIPQIPIFIDSPLAKATTGVFEMHPEAYDHGEDLVREAQRLFRFELVQYVQDVEESKKLNERKGPMIVIAASGMCESGRILHHLLHGINDDRNTVLIVGFQAEHTLGRRIVEGQSTVKIFGDAIPLRARVEILHGYSAHADRGELRSWLNRVRERSPRLRDVFLVHGEPEAQDAFAAVLRGDGYRVTIPGPGDRHRI